jgi:hypothetical protein
MNYESAPACWSRLDAIKRPLLLRCQRYASLTIPKICLPEGFSPESVDQTHDFQSVGAQAVNHVTNKIMLAMFAPSRPFMALGLDEKSMKAAAQQGIKDEDVAPVLAGIERKAVKKLDDLNQRPKLYAGIRHLVVTGNVLLELKKDSIRTYGLKFYCVKRTQDGKPHTIIIREKVKFDELDATVQEALGPRYHDHDEVEHYRHICRQANGDMVMTQWINGDQLPKKFNGKWPEADCPFLPLTWDLADESDYGTGLVEEYAGDFEALSVLAEATVDGAVLGAEYRWLVNPTGMTSAEDLNNSKNGDAINGTKDDISPTQGGNPAAVQEARLTSEVYEKRIARGFLMNSAVTRNAERVTAEEIRITAQELETSFGGVYSTLAASIQLPVGRWLLTTIDVNIKGARLTVTIVTGLDALSRNGDLENFKLAMQDYMAFATLPPQLVRTFNSRRIAGYIGAGRGVDLLSFLNTPEEQAQIDKADAAAAAQAQGMAAHAQARGEAQGQQAAGVNPGSA